MITGSEEESRALMMNAAVRVVAANGFEGFTTKKWAAEAGVAEGSLYYHFKSKNDLLDQTFLFVNKDIAEVCSKVDIPELTKEELCKYIDQSWKNVFHYLLENPEKLLYGCRYRTSTRYTESVRKTLTEIFKDVLESLSKLDEYISNRSGEKVDWVFLRGILLDSTSMLALRLTTGCLDDVDKAEKQYETLIMRGLIGLT